MLFITFSWRFPKLDKAILIFLLLCTKVYLSNLSHKRDITQKEWYFSLNLLLLTLKTSFILFPKFIPSLEMVQFIPHKM